MRERERERERESNDNHKLSRQLGKTTLLQRKLEKKLYCRESRETVMFRRQDTYFMLINVSSLSFVSKYILYPNVYQDDVAFKIFI